jgi:negative regulator of flagellin synthesis FlgM
MSVEHIYGTPEVRRVIKPKQTKRVASSSQATGKSDKISISDEAKKAQQLEADLRLVKKAPDIREEKVEQARERLASGYYLKKEVVEKIAERIAQALGIG